jgi:hypothetical protein
MFMKTTNDHIGAELQLLAPRLATAGRGMPYSVPHGYFENFPESTVSRLNAQPKQDVPEGYFEHFALNMLQKVRTNEVREELEGIAPVLNTLSKSMPYSLPEGYFEQWKPAIQEPAVQQPAKIISFGGGFRWKQWAAAAAILLTAGLAWQLWVNSPDNAPATAAINPAAVDSLLSGLDANSLSGYLETEQSGLDFTSLLSMAEQDIETGVKQLSTEELKWYLENQAISIPGS